VRLVGPARAKEIILECRRYGAEEARTLGLVHRVVPGNDLMKHSREYAQMLLAKPFKPLTEMKARINAIARTAMPEVNAMTEGFLQRD
jgi:enoyl-CoA hydratase/carnithine racemase